MWRGALFLGILLGCSTLVAADVYKCPDGKGGTHYQNSPCIEREDDPVIITEPRSAPMSPPSLSPIPSLVQEEQERNAKKMEMRQALVALYRLEVRWLEALQLAGNTARIALAGPVGNLQSLKQEMEVLLVPMCLARPKGLMIANMGEIIQGYLGFMSSAYYDPSKRFAAGRKLFEQYKIDAGICGN